MSNTSKQLFNPFYIIVITLLVINIIITLQAGKKAEQLEIMKVGGTENRTKLQQIMNHDMYKAQYAENFDMLLQQLNGDMNSGILPISEENIEFSEEPININEEESINIMDDNELQG